MGSFAGLILAAGRGSRFHDESGPPIPKVLRPALGRPLISYVVEALRSAGVDDIAVVTGYQAEEVERALGDGFRYARQPEQRGSGDAVRCAAELFDGFVGHVVIMCGDSPLFRAATVTRMMRAQVADSAAATLASAVLDAPTGYGRILRDPGGRVTAIVEEKCADAAQRDIREVNGGAYVFDAPWLFANIGQMAKNEAGEYNLTDMVRVAIEQGRRVATVECDPEDLLGVNTPEQLKVVEDILRRR